MRVWRSDLFTDNFTDFKGKYSQELINTVVNTVVSIRFLFYMLLSNSAIIWPNQMSKESKKTCALIELFPLYLFSVKKHSVSWSIGPERNNDTVPD